MKAISVKMSVYVPATWRRWDSRHLGKTGAGAAVLPNVQNYEIRPIYLLPCFVCAASRIRTIDDTSIRSIAGMCVTSFKLILGPSVNLNRLGEAPRTRWWG